MRKYYSGFVHLLLLLIGAAVLIVVFVYYFTKIDRLSLNPLKQNSVPGSPVDKESLREIYKNKSEEFSELEQEIEDNEIRISDEEIEESEEVMITL